MFFGNGKIYERFAPLVPYKYGEHLMLDGLKAVERFYDFSVRTFVLTAIRKRSEY